MLWIIQPALVSDAGQSSNNGYILTVWAGQDTVDPGGNTTIYATVVDSTYLAVPGVSLNFSAVAGDGTVQTTSASTDGSGQCAIGLTLGSLTTQVNVFDSSGYGVSTSCVVTVNPPPPNYQMSISADKNPVKNGETTTVQVRVADSNSGAGLAGATVSFGASGDATLGAFSATTDGNGWCSFPVTAGTLPSQITAATISVSNSFTLRCPSSGDTYNVSMTADQNPLPANGGGMVHGSFTDATLGLPISGRQLMFTVLSGDGTLPASSATTDDSGNYAVAFQGGSQPTTIQVTACDASGALTGVLQTLTMGILVHTYQLSLSSTQSMLQAGQQAMLSARLLDAGSGQPVSGAPLNFQVTGGGDGVLSYAGTTYASGIFTTDTNGTVSLTFIGGYLNSTLSVTDPTFSGATQSTVIGTVSTNTTGTLTLSADASVVAPGASTMLHAALWDATTGTPVSGGTITYQVIPGDGFFSSGTQTITAYTDAYGHCDLPFSGGSSPSIITATASNYTGASANVTVGVQAVTSNTYSLSLSSSQSSLAPNATATVSAQLVSSSTGPVSGATLNILVSGGDGVLFDGTNSMTSATLTTDVNGAASITFIGGYQNTILSVTDSTYSGATQSTVIAAAIPKDNGTLTLSADAGALTPGASCTLHAALLDTTTGMAVSGGTITYQVTPGGGGLSFSTATTDGNGNCDITFYGGSSPSVVTATASNYTGATAICTVGVEVGQVVQSDTYSLSLSTSQSSLVPGSTATVSAQLMDSTTGQPMAGATLNFQISGGDGMLFDGATSSITSVALTTDANGSAGITFVGGSLNTTLSVTDSASGAAQSTVIAALILKDAGSLTLSADDNVMLPGATAVLYSVLSDTTTGTPVPVSGGTITYQVTSGNGVFSSGGPTFTASTGIDGTCGVPFYGGSSPSIVTATASDYTGATTTFHFGVQAVVPDTYSLTLSPAQTVLAAGDNTTIGAQLYDVTTGTAVPNVSILFTVTGGDATLSGGASVSATTDPNGNCSVTLTGGVATSTLSVADQAGLATPGSLTFNVAHGYQLTMRADQPSLLSTALTTIHLLLVNANTFPPTPLQNTWISLSDTDHTSDISATSVTTGTDGTATVTFTMSQSPSVTVSAWDAGGLGASGTCTLTKATAPVYHLDLIPADPSLPAGQHTNLTATLTDPNGAAVSRAGLTFAMRANTDGSVSPASATTDDNGQLVATFTFGTQQGVVDVTADSAHGSASNSFTFDPLSCGCGNGNCPHDATCSNGVCTSGTCTYTCLCGNAYCPHDTSCSNCGGNCPYTAPRCGCPCAGTICTDASGCTGGSCQITTNNCSCGVSGCGGSACIYAANPAPTSPCGCTSTTTKDCYCGTLGCGGTSCIHAANPAPTSPCGCTSAAPNDCHCGVLGCGGTACIYAANPAHTSDCGCGNPPPPPNDCHCGVAGCLGRHCVNAAYPPLTSDCGCLAACACGYSMCVCGTTKICGSPTECQIQAACACTYSKAGVGNTGRTASCTCATQAECAGMDANGYNMSDIKCRKCSCGEITCRCPNGISDPCVRTQELHDLCTRPACACPCRRPWFSDTTAGGDSACHCQFGTTYTNADFGQLQESCLPVVVNVVKKGSSAQARGLIVKKGDILEFSCFLGGSLLPSSVANLQWFFAARKMNGDWTPWTSIGPEGQSSMFERTMSNAGVYRVKVVLNSGQGPEFEFLRNHDEFAGFGKAGQFDCFGVAETDALVNFVKAAQTFLGSTYYAMQNVVPAQYGWPQINNDPNTNDIIRCNIFVAHRASEVGIVVPHINGLTFAYPPLANQWAGTQDCDWTTPTFEDAIDHWALWRDQGSEWMKPGMVIAHPNPGDSGHCAIVDYDGEGIGAGESGTVNKLYTEFFDDGTSGFREYAP